ncbi:ScbA/BarX family gamma-butyrolactone biosynthesis protein [Streptomyces sp. NBC_00316]|uniref:ScbA/BarX family gamma-butyrolactone biosynthesis protein n=1 Tax=Streptomyces sp. NBC_00316 TaxID=2975710 RepID=UPI00324A82E5
MAETMRQTTMLLGHAEFGVPVGDQFVMWELGYAAPPERLWLSEGFEERAEPWDITVDVSCSRIKRRGRGLGSMELDLLVHRSGSRISAGGGRISCMPARVYQRLRGDRQSVIGVPVPLLPAVAPRTAGRTAERDVVLSPTAREGMWELRLDAGHPALFGRPNDHVPGILLLEAVRQAAHVIDPGHVFLRYVEIDRPCWVEARTAPSDDRSTTGVEVRAVQDGETAFISTFESPARAEENQDERP